MPREEGTAWGPPGLNPWELLSTCPGTSAPHSAHLFHEFSVVLCRLRCFLSSSNIKEGASGAYSCNTHTTLTGATSTNFPELPNSTAASEFYLHVYVYEPSAYPSSHLPAFSLFSTIGKKIVCQFRFLV